MAETNLKELPSKVPEDKGFNVWTACAYGDHDSLKNFIDNDQACVSKADEQVTLILHSFIYANSRKGLFSITMGSTQ